MLLIMSLLLLIIVIFSAIFLGNILKISPEQREFNDKEQMIWIREFKQRVQEKKT
ncbi:hypothetical protein LXJ15735_34030 [Lacrimispora xylanolytica]